MRVGVDCKPGEVLMSVKPCYFIYQWWIKNFQGTNHQFWKCHGLRGEHPQPISWSAVGLGVVSIARHLK
jgi:hypothetical protein